MRITRSPIRKLRFQNHSRMPRDAPIFARLERRHSISTVLGILARPHLYPLGRFGRREQRFGRWIEMQVYAEIHQQQPVVAFFAKKTEKKSFLRQNSSIHAAWLLGAEHSIFTAQPQQIPMKSVDLR